MLSYIANTHLHACSASYSYTVWYTGLVTLLPSREALVCGVGEQLELTCSTTETFLRWNITFPEDFEATIFRTETQLLNYNTITNRASPLVVNSATINFIRTSSQGVLPLTSTLLIDHVIEGLNGTVVSCMGLLPGNVVAASSTTTIHIIDPASDFGRSSHKINRLEPIIITCHSLFISL